VKEKAMSEKRSELRTCVRCGTLVNVGGECPACMDRRPKVEQTHDQVQGLPKNPFSHCPAPERGDTKWPDQGAYIDPAPKTPETLVEVVRELEDVARRLRDFPPSKGKDEELRSLVIKSAITINGCAATWVFERENRPGMREAPMPGEHSSKMLNVRRELESIAFAIDSYLQSKTDKSEKGNILERLKQVVVATNGLQHEWLADEYAMGSQARDLEAFDAERKEPSKHLLLFFGPSVANDRTMKEMKRTGTLPENQMDDRINQLIREGWRVVFRHFDPSFHVEQWRIVLEKP
jgi:hypothetical protein